MSRATVRAAIVKYLVAESSIATPASATAHLAPALPVSVVTGVNDRFVLTPGGGLGTPETFVMQPGVFTTLASLESVMSTAVGSLSSEPFSAHCVVSDNGAEIQLSMTGTAGAADNGNTLSEGNGGAALLGFSITAVFAGGLSGNGTIPFLGAVFPFPAKFTPEGEFFPNEDPALANPGLASGAMIFLRFADLHEGRIAMGGSHSGRKAVEYGLEMICLFRSSKPESQAAGADNETFLDALDTAIRAQRQAGTGPPPDGDGSAVIFQWGEGVFPGGTDLEAVTFFPKNLSGGAAMTQIYSTVKVAVVEIIQS